MLVVAQYAAKRRVQPLQPAVERDDTQHIQREREESIPLLFGLPAVRDVAVNADSRHDLAAIIAQWHDNRITDAKRAIFSLIIDLTGPAIRLDNSFQDLSLYTAVPGVGHRDGMTQDLA